MTGSSHTLTEIPDPGEIVTEYGSEFRQSHIALIPGESGGFSGAVVWQVETDLRRLALRATCIEHVDRERLAELHRLLAFLSRSGFALMPAPIANPQGETFFARRGRIWQLEPWMPGTADSIGSPSSARLTNALQTLAQWHLAAAKYDPSERGAVMFGRTETGRSLGMIGRFQQIGRWNEPLRRQVQEYLARLDWPEFAALAQEILDLFSRLAVDVASRVVIVLDSWKIPIQPCLRDIWREHVLFTGDRVTGLIDPHSARSDCVATDLARLLGSYVADDRSRWAEGLRAYHAIRPLSLNELALVELFDQTSVLLSGLTWIDWCCLQGRVFADREKVISRLQSIVSRMRNLSASNRPTWAEFAPGKSP